MGRQLNFHEDLKRSTVSASSSDRKFGFLVGSAFVLISLWPLKRGGDVRLPALVLGSVLLLAALVRPAWLNPLNRLWTQLGLLMGRVMNPVATAILFYLVFTPAGLLSRLLGKDSLHLKFDPAASTYWIHREPPGPEPATMLRQF